MAAAPIEGPWWNAGEVARGRNIGAHENKPAIGATNTSRVCEAEREKERMKEKKKTRDGRSKEN